jgi:hypothetical protein
MSTIDVKRVVKYPPEAFISSQPINLILGDNKLAEYTGFEKNFILSIQGLSFNRVSNLMFHLDVDGFINTVKLDNLASVRGIDYEENIKVPSTRSATLRITSPTNITAFQWRHRVTVFKPNVAMKLQLGLPLTTNELMLANKFNLHQLIRQITPEHFNLFSGIEDFKTISVSMSSSGVISTIPVPKGKKVILSSISVTRPAAPNSAFLIVNRDGIDNVLNLDLFCLPNLEYEVPLRVVALDRLEILLNIIAAGTYNVRITYGIGRLTIVDKIKWIPDELTDEERRIAEENDLFDKIDAGVI